MYVISVYNLLVFGFTRAVPKGKAFLKNVKETYAQALKDLERIQNGKLHIGLAELNEKWHKMPYLMCRSSKPEQIKKMDLSGY